MASDRRTAAHLPLCGRMHVAADRGGDTDCGTHTGCGDTPAAENYIFNETPPVGSRITITLDENPTTGYRWNVTSSAGLQYVNETFIAPERQRSWAPVVCTSGSMSQQSPVPPSLPRYTGAPGKKQPETRPPSRRISSSDNSSFFPHRSGIPLTPGISVGLQPPG